MRITLPRLAWANLHEILTAFDGSLPGDEPDSSVDCLRRILGQITPCLKSLMPDADGSNTAEEVTFTASPQHFDIMVRSSLRVAATMPSGPPWPPAQPGADPEDFWTTVRTNVQATALSLHNHVMAASVDGLSPVHSMGQFGSNQLYGRVLRIASDLHAAKHHDHLEDDNPCPVCDVREQMIQLLDAPGDVAVMGESMLMTMIVSAVGVLAAAMDPEQTVPISVEDAAEAVESVQRIHLDILAQARGAES